MEEAGFNAEVKVQPGNKHREKCGSSTCWTASGRKYKSRLCSNDVCIEDETIESSLRDCEVEDLDEEDECYASNCKCYDERESVVCARESLLLPSASEWFALQPPQRIPERLSLHWTSWSR